MKYIFLFLILATTAHAQSYPSYETARKAGVNHTCRYMMIMHKDTDGTYKLIDNPDRSYYEYPACGKQSD